LIKTIYVSIVVMKNNITFKSVLLLLTMLMLTSCINCPKNYTSDIRSVMKPMKSQLKNFFANEQMYPSDTQRDILLEASGCKIVDPEKRLCSYKGNTFSYHSSEGTLYPEPIQTTNPQTSNPNTSTEVTPHEPQREEGINIYSFSILKENSLCEVDMTYQGEVLDIECIQHSCISK